MFFSRDALRSASALLLSGAALTLAACGGGGGKSIVPNAPANGSSTTRQVRDNSGSIASETPVASDVFAQSIGVNAYLGYWGSAYANTGQVVSLLKNLGVRHIRDAAYAGDPGACAADAQLASQGIGVLAVTKITMTQNDINTMISCLGPALEAVEPPNEYDLTHPSSDGNWPSTLAGYQRMLYSTVKSRSGAAVLAPGLTTSSAFGSLGSLSGSVDLANVHDYFAGHNPGSGGYGSTFAEGTYGSLAYFMNMSRLDTGAIPLWSTETGYGDRSSDLWPVPPTVKMHYILRTVLEHYNAGISHTYIYQLADSGIDEFFSFGLVDQNLTPKPAYTALKNLIGHVTDLSGVPPRTPLSYAISAPSSVHHLLLQRSDRSYSLVLWNDVDEWDPNSNTAISVGPASTTVQFTNAPSSLKVTTFDNSGNTSTSSLGSQTSTSLSVDGAATILDIVP